MDRTNRFYKIFITSMIVAIAIMLLASGIIALSKSMKLNLSFQANPNFHFEVYIQPQDSQSKNLVFRNFKKGNAEGEGIVMKNGLSTLKANTLSADSSFVDTYGSEFSIIIANYTAKDIMVLITSTATTSEGAGVPATIDTITPIAAAYSGSGDGAEVKYNISVANNVIFPQETFLEINFSELQLLSVTIPETEAYTFEGENTSIANTDYTAILRENTGFVVSNVVITTKSEKTLVRDKDFTWDEETGELVINSVTEELTITPEWGAKLKTGLEITDILYEVFSTNTVSASANIQPEEVVAGVNGIADDVLVYAIPSGPPSVATDNLQTIILGNYDQYPDFRNATADRSLDVNTETTNTNGKIRLYRDGTTAYILSENKIFANEDSSYLFSNSVDEDTDRTQHAISAITFNNFDTSRVEDMTSMFHGFDGNDLNLSSFDTSSVTDMKGMLAVCNALSSLDVSSFDTSSVTDMSSMFYSCSSLTSLVLSNFNTSKVTSMTRMFSGCNFSSLDLSSFDTSSATMMDYMFSGCNFSLDLSNFNTSSVVNMSYMFWSCKLTSLDLSSFNTSKVTNMGSMFLDCSKLTSLDLSSFDTSKVTNMSSMFSGCSKLTSLDLSNFDTSKVTNMKDMFQSCSNLTSLDLSSFDTSSVTNMTYMCYYCSNLTSLDLSRFDTSSVTSMSNMFFSCNNLITIYVSEKWSTAKVTSSIGMFSNCTSLKGGNGSSPYEYTDALGNTVAGYGVDDATYARIDGGTSNPGYFTDIANRPAS